jgi:predicted acyl esterase
MDIVADIRVIDEDNSEVPYTITRSFYMGGYHYPVAMGWLKVSHRKTDPEKSTIYRPWHTHTKEDYQPLKPDEVVEAEVEIWPTTAYIRKGHRIRLDVQPTDGYDHPMYHDYDESYHKGAANTIYTGPDHPCYLQLPVIPPK